MKPLRPKPAPAAQVEHKTFTFDSDTWTPGDLHRFVDTVSRWCGGDHVRVTGGNCHMHLRMTKKVQP